MHPGNKLASIVAFNKASIEHQMARDVAMQVAAMNPVSVLPSEVPQHVIDQELEIARDKAREAGKPENLLDRIAQGSLTNSIRKIHCFNRHSSKMRKFLLNSIYTVLTRI